MRQLEALEVLKSGRNVHLTGEPGAGKTFTIELFKQYLQEKGISYAITASTGIAASHLNGNTIHSWSGLGIRRGLTKEDLDGMQRNHWVTEKIKGVRVLVIDEISMLDAITLNDVSNVLMAIHGNKFPFGGIQVVLVGDFFQLPPVSKGDEEKRFAFDSEAWIMADLKVCYLTEQHRQSDTRLMEVLTAMRNGTVTEEHKEIIRSCSKHEKSETRLYTHNTDVDRLNATELAKLSGKEMVYNMKEGGIPALVQTLKRSCLSPERLVLKVGAVVMFTRNNPKAGYVNGSLGKVTKFQGGEPVIQLKNGKIVIPETAEWEFKEKEQTKAFITQLPLRLAWAITIHKSQGMSLDSAVIDLSGTFEFGQGYVALSRVRTLQGIHLMGINDMAFAMHPRVVEQDIIFRKQGA